MVKLIHHLLFEPTNFVEQLSVAIGLCVVVVCIVIGSLALMDDGKDF